MKFVYCKLCRRRVEDDDYPNIWGVSDGNGELRVEEAPKSPYCEKCDGRIRLWLAERERKAMLQITAEETMLEDLG